MKFQPDSFLILKGEGTAAAPGQTDESTGELPLNKNMLQKTMNGCNRTVSGEY
jgi:hypothetical protein